MIHYDALRPFAFEPVVQSYTARDMMLYALGLNLGQDPLDAEDLRHVAMDPPAPVVMMPMTLARLGPWMRDPRAGINYKRIVVGEVGLTLHADLPAAATVVGHHEVTRVTDKGAGRGALVTVRRRLQDQASGSLLAEYEQVTFCRADGGFAVDGRHDPAPEQEPWRTPDRPADLHVALPTSRRQALIYRLSGDMNPLHSDPAAASSAGFERPILHGLATVGMAGHALDKFARRTGARLRSLRARLSAPVYPGETLTLETWMHGEGLLYRLRNGAGQEALSLGRCLLC